ncbi:tRNA 2-selenouridine(34) synthase MnmH [Methyloversatilis thermotolerans]|uniref:tRNA 2-selenouridine(34) synthase MnmH n=1 Tax=Methyloversatilis thermotolerans TaxID=1346290 RepID=UPI00036785FC|nr:tRNA 2-selenouridine(34) synthase MnmH [Methyloversatilis thermotolerans]
MNAPRRPAGIARIGELQGFDMIIDTRSPAEFALDHMPGAINCPALDDAQRAEIGTLYKQVSPFVARRRGAALVAINIGRHLLDRFQDEGPDWRPLIYCWRGGRRSGAFVTVFRQIGWDAHQLEGGYKSYRRSVLEALATLPGRFRFRVISGPTGSGKSRLLERLAARGAQTLDLEALAAHKGSVLGRQPGMTQPSQKLFESRLVHRLAGLDPDRPVHVEAESKRVGLITLPQSLLDALHNAPCVRLELPAPVRTEFLLRDYRYMMDDVENLIGQLARLTELRGRETVTRWSDLARAGRWTELVTDLLASHYDPLYARSQGGRFRQHADAPVLTVDRVDDAGLDTLVDQVLALDGGKRPASASPAVIAQMR